MLLISFVQFLLVTIDLDERFWKDVSKLVTVGPVVGQWVNAWMLSLVVACAKTGVQKFLRGHSIPRVSQPQKYWLHNFYEQRK